MNGSYSVPGMEHVEGRQWAGFRGMVLAAIVAFSAHFAGPYLALALLTISALLASRYNSMMWGNDG